jgi:drug/metabolite transporter (DMT)-like permease
MLLAASRFLLKDRKAEVAALLIIAGSAFLVWPVSHFREKAKPIGSESVEKLKVQSTRRQDTAWVFYALAALACVTAAAGGESGGTAGKMLFWMLFLAAIASIAVALWLQIKECELFYRDL